MGSGRYDRTWEKCETDFSVLGKLNRCEVHSRKDTDSSTGSSAVTSRVCADLLRCHGDVMDLISLMLK